MGGDDANQQGYLLRASGSGLHAEHEIQQPAQDRARACETGSGMSEIAKLIEYAERCERLAQAARHMAGELTALQCLYGNLPMSLVQHTTRRRWTGGALPYLRAGNEAVRPVELRGRGQRVQSTAAARQTTVQAGRTGATRQPVARQR